MKERFGTTDTEEHLIVQDLSAYDVTYAMVSGMEAMHGEFLRHFVKAGTESWRPLHFVLVCSIECFKSVFFKVTCGWGEYCLCAHLLLFRLILVFRGFFFMCWFSCFLGGWGRERERVYIWLYCCIGV